jgi:hypothetical protein
MFVLPNKQENPIDIIVVTKKFVITKFDCIVSKKVLDTVNPKKLYFLIRGTSSNLV